MKHFLEVGDLSKAEIEHVLQLSDCLHQTREDALHQKTILFCFEKPSLRTKVGTEVAINQLDGKVIHIDPSAFLGGKIMQSRPVPGLDERESLKDTVRNVSKWCDAIFTRVFDHSTLDKLCEFSQIPVINALSDLHHPMQALADFRTIKKQYGDKKVPITFIGDANNVARSLIEMGIILGYPMAFTGPEAYGWSEDSLNHFEVLAKTNQGTFHLYKNVGEAAVSSQVLYADTFVSMGEEDVYQEKIMHFKKFQINKKLFDSCLPDASFMHCLPAHREVEVTNEVIDSCQSLVYQQAENRMIVSKGLFAYLINNQEPESETHISHQSKLIKNEY